MSIEIKNLNFKFNSKDKLFFEELTFSLKANQLTFLIGASGSGKSTLAQILSGLIPIKNKKWTYQIDDLIYSRFHHNRFMKQVGYVFQNPDYQLLALKVIGELLYNVPKNKQEEIKGQIDEYLLLLNLDQSFLERFSFTLSFGEKRKILIIKFLLSNRKFLILDEPSSNLDYTSRHELMRRLQQIVAKTNRYILVISHDLDLAYEYADRILLLDRQYQKQELKAIEKDLLLTSDYFFEKQWKAYFGKIISASKHLNSLSDLQTFLVKHKGDDND